jgi:hypothetical protein
LRLLQTLVSSEVHASRVRYRWDADASGASSRLDNLFEEFDAKRSCRFSVRHNVRLTDRDEIFGIKEFSNSHLMLESPFAGEGEPGRVGVTERLAVSPATMRTIS